MNPICTGHLFEGHRDCVSSESARLPIDTKVPKFDNLKSFGSTIEEDQSIRLSSFVCAP